MPDYPTSEPRPEPSSANPAKEPRRPPRVSASSPPYYLGIPARVWLAAMSGRKHEPAHTLPRVDLHQVHQDGTPVNGHHRFGKVLR